MSIFRIHLYLKLYFFIKSLFIRNKNFKNYICKKFTKFTNKKYSEVVSQLRVGFYLVLKYLKKKEPQKKEIIVSSYNLAEMVNICSNFNLKIIYPKLNKNLFLDPEDLKKKINKNTLAVVVTNIFNNYNDIINIKKICNKTKIPLIEDNAIYFGNYYKRGKEKIYTGSFGDYSLHSFNIMKNISAMYGGLVSSNNKDFFIFLENELKTFKKFPFIKYLFQCVIFLVLKIISIKLIYKYSYLPLIKSAHIKKNSFLLKFIYPSLKFKKTKIPKNYFTKINDLSIKMIWLQLKDIKNFQYFEKQREMTNRYYFEKLKKKNINGIKLFELKTPSFQNYNGYPIIVKNKYKISNYLFSQGIETKTIHYVDCQKIFNKKFKGNKKFLYQENILCLPNNRKITKDYVDLIVFKIAKFYS
jgi:dTDP-4-amino-4,6-dideoxygalactose transaminase|tara:strand:+ start:3974 stop:5212 length:1239 start_codon:yes stop_codon:yes gene_type:complete